MFVQNIDKITISNCTYQVHKNYLLKSMYLCKFSYEMADKTWITLWFDDFFNFSSKYGEKQSENLSNDSNLEGKTYVVFLSVFCMYIRRAKSSFHQK